MPFSNSPRHQYHRAQRFHLPTIQIHYTFHHLSLLVPLEFHLQLRPLHLGHRALTKYTICLKSCLMLAGGDSGAEERARNTFTTNLQNSPFGNNHQLGALLVQAGMTHLGSRLTYRPVRSRTLTLASTPAGLVLVSRGGTLHMKNLSAPP